MSPWVCAVRYPRVMKRSLAFLALLLVACDLIPVEEECPDVDCIDSFTVVFDGGGLMEVWTVWLTDETGREESFKCRGMDVVNLTDETLLVWCEPEGFTVAGWTMASMNMLMTDKGGEYEWEQGLTWEADYGYGEDCPAACETAEVSIYKEALEGDSG